jgi:hypothetical protein
MADRPSFDEAGRERAIAVADRGRILACAPIQLSARR